MICVQVSAFADLASWRYSGEMASSLMGLEGLEPMEHLCSPLRWLRQTGHLLVDSASFRKRLLALLDFVAVPVTVTQASLRVELLGRMTTKGPRPKKEPTWAR